VTGAARPAAPLAREQDDADQMTRLQTYLARHPGTQSGPAAGELPGVQVSTGGGNRVIIHYSLKALLDKLEERERAALHGAEPS